MRADTDLHLGRVIREYRLARGYSQAELSRLSGVPQGTLSSIESGRQQPSARTLRRISITFGVSVDKMFREATDDGDRLTQHSQIEGLISSFVREIQLLEPHLSEQDRTFLLRIARVLANDHDGA